MIVTADRVRNLVTIHSDAGSRIILTWSGALLLGTQLREASVEAEPPARPGKSYVPSTERARV
jgi:hypothetical protein